MADINVAGIVSIVTLYSAILIIGIFAVRSKKKKRRVNQYPCIDEETFGFLLADRRVGLTLGAFTLTATWAGGGSINNTVESIYTKGLIWTQYPWAHVFSLIIGGLLFAKPSREKDFMTVLDPLQEQYGNIMGCIVYLPALLGELFWSASILSVLGGMLSSTLNIDIRIAVSLSILVVVAYTTFGGLYSVLYTDIAQLVGIAMGMTLTIPFALSHGNVKSIAHTNYTWSGEIKGYEIGRWFDYAMMFIFGGVPWQGYFQRVLSSKSPSSSRLQSYLAALGCLSIIIPSIFIGSAAKSADWSQVANLTNHIDENGSISGTQYTLSLVLKYLIPSWVEVIGVGVLSASIMSSIDSHILSISSILGYNIYQVLFKPAASDKDVVRMTRACVLIVGAVILFIGITVPNSRALYQCSFDIVYVILFPQLLAALHFQSANTYGSIAAIIVGLFFRIAGGEEEIGLPAVIQYPMYTDGRQLFPFRTMSMFLSFFTLIIVSRLMEILFHNGFISRKFDYLAIVERNEQRYELSKRAAIMMSELNYRLNLQSAHVQRKETNTLASTISEMSKLYESSQDIFQKEISSPSLSTRTIISSQDM